MIYVLLLLISYGTIGITFIIRGQVVKRVSFIHFHLMVPNNFLKIKIIIPPKARLNLRI